MARTTLHYFPKAVYFEFPRVTGLFRSVRHAVAFLDEHMADDRGEVIEADLSVERFADRFDRLAATGTAFARGCAPMAVLVIRRT